MLYHVTRATRHLLFWSLVLGAVTLSSVRLLLIQADGYRGELERKIVELSGVPLSIGKLGANMRGFSPELVLKDIAVREPEPAGGAAVQLQEVRIGIDLLQWLWSRDALSSSWVTLVGAKISVVREVDGRFSIRGLNGDSDSQPLWLLQGGKYEILKSEITWQDLQRHGRPITFQQFDLLLKNDFDRREHEVHVLSALPETYGRSLRLSARLRGDVFAGNDLDGRLYLKGQDIHWDKLITGELPLDLQVGSGNGDLELWSDWQASAPVRLVAKVAGRQWVLQRGERSLQLDELTGQLQWQQKSDGWQITGRDLSIAAGGKRWDGGEFTAAVFQDGRTAARIGRLELEPALRMASFFADAGALTALPATLHGVLEDAGLYAENAGASYAVQGRFRDLGMTADGQWPELSGLQGEIVGTDRQGELRIDAEQVGLVADKLFRWPLILSRLQGRVQWQRVGDDWRIDSDGLELDTPDFATTSRFGLMLPVGKAPQLDLRMVFGRFDDMARVKHYLPAKIMDQDAVAWLDDAFVAGRINQGEVVVQGSLDKLPFADGSGKFEVLFGIDQGEIQFNELWPHLRDLQAEVHFEGEGLTVGLVDGRSEQVRIDQSVIEIPSLTDSHRVWVQAKVGGAVNDALRFLQKTPLSTTADNVLSSIAVAGETEVSLDLSIPFVATEASDVEVLARLDGARIDVKSAALPIDKVSGVLRFTEDGLYSDGLDAVSLGYPIRAKIDSRANATAIVIDGRTDIPNLRKQFVFLDNDLAKGALSYRAVLELPFAKEQAGQLLIATDLQGVTIDAADDLAKTAEQKRDATLEFTLSDTPGMPLRVRYGDVLQAALTVDKAKQNLSAGHIVYGSGVAEFLSEPGLKLEVKRPTFKLSSWTGLLGNAEAVAKWPALSEIAIDTEQLQWKDRQLGALYLALQRVEQGWQGRINCKAAQGVVRIPGQFGTDGRIGLDMDSLDLSALADLDFAQGGMAVTDLPLIDIASNKLWWRSVNLGKLTLETERLPNGVHFKQFSLTGPSRKIQIGGDWLRQEGGTATQIRGTLSMDGFGQFLSELHFADDMKETHAEIDFNGGWTGAPYQFSLATLNGQLQINLTDGRISSIEPGFGRLLGLIAMEQWAKRLSLDFSDMYKKGMAFDAITGHFKIGNGIATTQDLLVNAVSAKLRIKGDVNLVDKTLNQQVAVVPKSSDALPIAGTIVGGIATMITRVVTDDYKEGYFFGSAYQLQGPWHDIQVLPLRDKDGLLKKTWNGLTDFSWMEAPGRP